MAPTEFARRMVGKPWVRWRSDFDAVDCYGIVILYFREVLGIELGEVPHTDIAEGFSRAHGWHECPPEPGATGFMAWRDGAPDHCGVLLPDGRMLHAGGGGLGTGSVRVSRLSAMARLYSDIRFYRYAPC